MINWLHNDVAPDFTIEVALINCHYPVTHDSFVLQWGVAVQAVPGLPADKATKLAAAMSRHSVRASSRTSRSGSTRRGSRTRC